MNIYNQDICTGCGACINICPEEALVMTEESRGFQYPSVIEQKCVNC